ncbi:MAG: hypothetical protein HQK73_04355 [Desulfamplus sp.]|nr:hypothetical protein [Desulfamplus sp.]
MKPLFFPFTSLTKYDADCLLNFFETFSYLSTSSDDELAVSEPEWFQTLWREKKVITPVTLSKEELTPLLGSIKSWRAWAEINYGKQTKQGYLKSIFRETPYFTSDSDIFTIRSQITNGINQLQPDKKAHKKDYNNSLLFLRLAAMADLENEAIDQKLLSIEELETNLFAELKGSLDDENIDKENLIGDSDKISLNSTSIRENSIVITDRGELMTEQRILSWLAFFLTKKGNLSNSAPCHFATTSRAVVDFLLSVVEKNKLMLDIENFKVHKEKNSPSPEDNLGAWSETYKIQWSNDIYSFVRDFIAENDLNMNITDDELFQFTGQTLTVTLVSLNK